MAMDLLTSAVGAPRRLWEQKAERIVNTWKRGLAVLVLSLLALVVAAPAGASHSSYQYGRVKVMSQVTGSGFTPR